MGHHRNAAGEFQNDKPPILKPDNIRVSFKKPASWRALRVLAEDYRGVDSGLSDDIDARLDALGAPSRSKLMLKIRDGSAFDEAWNEGTLKERTLSGAVLEAAADPERADAAYETIALMGWLEGRKRARESDRFIHHADDCKNFEGGTCSESCA